MCSSDLCITAKLARPAGWDYSLDSSSPKDSRLPNSLFIAPIYPVASLYLVDLLNLPPENISSTARVAVYPLAPVRTPRSATPPILNVRSASFLVISSNSINLATTTSRRLFNSLNYRSTFPKGSNISIASLTWPSSS